MENIIITIVLLHACLYIAGGCSKYYSIDWIPFSLLLVFRYRETLHGVTLYICQLPLGMCVLYMLE